MNNIISYLVGNSTDNHLAIRALFERGATERIFNAANHNEILQYVARVNAGSSGNLPKGVYFTINPCQAETGLNKNGGVAQVADAHITSRQILYIDIDAVKSPANPALNPAHICATPAEVARTQELAHSIIAYLCEMGISQEPIILSSGNGTHVFYKIDMSNDAESLKVMEDFLQTLSDKFSGALGDVDVKIKNAGRICRFPLTMNRKGPDGVEEGRNWRNGGVISMPEKDASAWRSDPVDVETIKTIGQISVKAKEAKKRKDAADRKAKSRGGRKSEQVENNNRQTAVKRGDKGMQIEHMNRADFIIDHVNLWLPEAYSKVDAPDDRNVWLGMLSSVKCLLGEAGFNAFDTWCQTSSHYDAEGNLQAWNNPARTEDDATEAVKLAASFIKLGFDLNLSATHMGFSLSDENLMSIEEIIDIIKNDNTLSVRWAWSTRVGEWYPAGVWAKDWTKRRLSHFNDNTRSLCYTSLFIGTENFDGFLKPVTPILDKADGRMMIFNETTSTWDAAADSHLNKVLARQNGYSITGEDKNGHKKTLSVKNLEAEIKGIKAMCDQVLMNHVGILPLRDGKLTWKVEEKGYKKSALTADDHITNTLPFSLADLQNTNTPKYDAVLNRIFEGDAQRIESFLQWQGAALFSAATTLQTPMLILLSEIGGTGKSMLFNILERLIGPGNACSAPLDDLTDRGILVKLAGKKINIDYDMDIARMMDNVSVLKQLVTGDAIMRRVVGSSDTVEFRYTGSMCAAANGSPSFKRYDAGLDRRLLLMPTTNIPVSSDERVYGYDKQIFNEEGAGILSKSVEAFIRMINNGGELLIPEICREAKGEMRAGMDVLSEYLNETWVASDDAKVVKIKDLYDEYVHFCRINNQHPVASRRFTQEARIKLEMAGVEISKPHNIFAARIERKNTEKIVRGFSSM